MKTRFGFNKLVIAQALANQNDRRGQGYTCAKCGKYIRQSEDSLLLVQGSDYFAIPRIPITEGGKSAKNCVIVCPRCFQELGQDGMKTIPYGALPYFDVRHRR